ALAVGESLNTIARRAKSNRTQSEELQLRWYFLERAAPAGLRVAWSRLVALEQEKDRLERSFPTVMVMAESETPKDTFLLNRGAYDKPGEKVQPGDRKSTRLNSSHQIISYAVFCL